MKVNSVMGLLLAVESGVGLAALPDYLVFQSRNLIKVLPKVEGPITEAHFVYPQSMKELNLKLIFFSCLPFSPHFYLYIIENENYYQWE